jgi:hypothetical protein
VVVVVVGRWGEGGGGLLGSAGDAVVFDGELCCVRRERVVRGLLGEFDRAVGCLSK